MSCFAVPDGGFVVARFDADGSIDATFGSGGSVTTKFDRHAVARALVIRPGGEIVAAGLVDKGSSRDAAMVRYRADGSIDSTFAAGGRMLTDFGGRNFGTLQWRDTTRMAGRTPASGVAERSSPSSEPIAGSMPSPFTTTVQSWPSDTFARLEAPTSRWRG